MKKQESLKNFMVMSRNDLSKVYGGTKKASAERCDYGKKCSSHNDCGDCACWNFTGKCGDWVK